MTTTNTTTPETIRASLYARVSTSGHGQDVGLQVATTWVVRLDEVP